MSLVNSPFEKKNIEVFFFMIFSFFYFLLVLVFASSRILLPFAVVLIIYTSSIPLEMLIFGFNESRRL